MKRYIFHWGLFTFSKMPLIWNKYPKIKEINTKKNIKTYLTRIEPLVKEISPEK